MPSAGFRDFNASGGPSIDTAELAARLLAANNNTVSGFRTGSLIMSDGFEGAAVSQNWGTSGPGTFAQDSTFAFQGEKSLLLTTGAVINDTLEISRPQPLVDLNPGKIGLECMFSPVGSAWKFGVGIWVHVPDPAGGFFTAYALAVFDPTGAGSDQFTVRHTDAETETVAGTVPTFTAGYWHRIKLVIDPKKFPSPEGLPDAQIGAYSKVLVNNRETDLSAYSLACVAPASFAAGQLYFIEPFFWAVTTAAAAQTMFMDNVILTINEP